MGCTTGMLNPWTKEEVDIQLEQLIPLLPQAELMGGGIIKLRGSSGFFNPNSLLDPNWLKGKITPEEYRDAIDYINRRTGYTYIGLSKTVLLSDVRLREQLRTQAGMAAVEDLNKRYTSIKFTYQPTAETVVMNILPSLGHSRLIVGNRYTVTYLYIAFL
ncbi:unnamed protein product [Adineta steineri]|uniref:Uncharacterized protein n=1 Tax=Adineta steineri TaxID=433720 RepID=A0A815SUU9_9BILA|nr:unnamed protein product [Adineta steineri]CAF1642789.1 unnamed protein product [Adineta steineri]